jgi:hypothetical protein
MFKNFNLFQNAKNGSTGILLFILQIAIVLVIFYTPMALKFNGNAPLYITLMYSLFVIGLYFMLMIVDSRSLGQIALKNICLMSCIGLILIPKSTSIIELIFLMLAIITVNFGLYFKNNQDLKKIKDENHKEHYIEVKWAKSKAYSQNALLYYLVFMGAVHYLTSQIRPELVWLTYSSLAFILIVIALSFIKKFTPISNLRVFLFYVSTYAVCSVTENSDKISIEIILPFIIAIVILGSIFEAFPTILYALKKDTFWKVYGVASKAFSDVTGRDNNDELNDFFDDINKNNANMWFDTIQHRIVIMSYKSYIFIEKHHYNGKEKIIEVFNENNLNFNKDALKQLTKLSGKKIEYFTDKEDKIAKQYSIKQITDYLSLNDIDYAGLNNEDFIVIDMMTI